jgi:hypothetical protein
MSAPASEGVSETTRQAVRQTIAEAEEAIARAVRVLAEYGHPDTTSGLLRIQRTRQPGRPHC